MFWPSVQSSRGTSASAISSGHSAVKFALCTIVWKVVVLCFDGWLQASGKTGKNLIEPVRNSFGASVSVTVTWHSAPSHRQPAAQQVHQISFVNMEDSFTLFIIIVIFCNGTIFQSRFSMKGRNDKAASNKWNCQIQPMKRIKTPFLQMVFRTEVGSISAAAAEMCCVLQQRWRLRLQTHSMHHFLTKWWLKHTETENTLSVSPFHPSCSSENDLRGAVESLDCVSSSCWRPATVTENLLVLLGGVSQSARWSEVNHSESLAWVVSRQFSVHQQNLRMTKNISLPIVTIFALLCSFFASDLQFSHSLISSAWFWPIIFGGWQSINQSIYIYIFVQC